MESALSPNTSAFLNYLYTFSTDDASKSNTVPNPTPNTNPTSFAPSTIFNGMPIPGRDTPEDTPPSVDDISINENINTEKDKKQQGALSDTDDSELDSPERELSKSKNRRVSGNGVNKRKVGQNHRKASVDEEEEEDSDSDEVSGHEDKRAHGNHKADGTTKGSGRKGRKSNAGEEGTGKKENKAARRKEQNRAAQKAFRERRETKVKDLEQKVAELEAKSYGASVENENLRGILKRLQEENISLKQSAFTFSMPVSGNSPNNSSQSNGTNTPNLNIPRPQTAKPPTPPLSSVDDGLRSIDEISNIRPKDIFVDSPESLISVNSGNVTDNSQSQQQQQPDLLQSNAFNAFMFGSNDSGNNTNTINGNDVHRPNAHPVQSQSSSTSSDALQSFGTQSSSSIATSSPSNQSDINALWASLYPQGVESLLSNQPVQQNGTQNNGNDQQISSALYSNNVNTTPFTLLNSQPAFMSFANAGENMWESLGLVNNPSVPQTNQNQSQFQQTQPSQQQQISQPMQAQQPVQPVQNQFNDFNKFAFRDPTVANDSMNNWNDITDNNVNDFLASLAGTGNTNTNMDADLSGGMDDEAFNAQLQQIFGGNSPSQLFNLQPSSSISSSNGMNTFSPTNYLNMSPSPLQSVSQSQSPTQSNAQSPQSSVSYNDKSSSDSPHSTAGSSQSSSTSTHPSSVSGAPAIIPAVAPLFESSCFKPSSTPGISTFGPPKTAAEIVHVVDTDGNIVKPSDLWMKFGMKHNHVVDHLMIDDLCDQMKAKATCNDGRLELTVKDAETMFGFSGDDEHRNRIERMKNRVTSG